MVYRLDGSIYDDLGDDNNLRDRSGHYIFALKYGFSVSPLGDALPRNPEDYGLAIPGEGSDASQLSTSLP